MTGEEIGREKKAKDLARRALRELIGVLSNGGDTWKQFVYREGYDHASEETRKRVIEILSEVAI